MPQLGGVLKKPIDASQSLLKCYFRSSTMLSKAIAMNSDAGGHLSDHYGRRILTVGTIGFMCVWIYCAALSPNHYMYFAVYLCESYMYTLRSVISH